MTITRNVRGDTRRYGDERDTSCHSCRSLADAPGPYSRFDPDKVHNSLTAGSLRGPGKLAVPPIVFAKEDESEAIGEHALTIAS